MIQNAMEYQTVVLAAFLHAIGKLLGRGRFSLLGQGQHPKFSADFVGAFAETFAHVSEVPLLRELVQKHHESSAHFAPEFLREESG